MTFEGRVALVTGAARGIGRAVAAALAGQKAGVVLNDIGPEDKLQAVALELSAATGANVIAIVADVKRYDEVQAMVRQVDRTFNRLDILVNNAGIIRRGSIETVTEQDWDDVMAVNLKGTFNCCKAATGIMIRQKHGKIVNVSSVAGKIGDITSAPGYGPSKAGMDALTKTLARQLAHYGINVNAVAPHAIETEMSAEWPPEKRKAIIEAIPLKRLGRPEDVAEAVLFLASDKAAFITGEILDVNGGFIMD
ncbi:MAG: 3-oxoacyl-ACP reductase FabG [Deltaproteobacteria bacterium]|nr:3-oxoacyl-ACP reductase FabG [Deltaproteobacteria bacterium]